MANQWLRLYSEFANDPKMQMMSEANQRRFVMVLCIRCSNGDVTLQDEEVAFQLRISNEEWAATKAVFVAKNLISEDNKPTAWDKRQFVSDSSAPRVARHRAKLKTACNVTETPPEQIQNRTDTESEPTKTSAPRFDACRHLVVQGVTESVAKDWLTLRRQKKAAATETAIAGVLRESEKAGMSLQSVLEVCCSRGWAGFKAAWVEKEKTTGPPRQQFISHADQSKLAAARAIFGTEIEGSHGTQHGRTIDITPPARQVGRENLSGTTGQLRLQVSEPVEDGTIVT